MLSDLRIIARIETEAPRALTSYLLCMHHADAYGEIHFTRDYIVNALERSWTMFKNDIASLSRISLVTYNIYGDEIDVELIDQGGCDDCNLL